jgi:uncharacterized Tic20 family protein
MFHNRVEIIVAGVAKVGASSFFIGAIVKIDVVLFALVVTTIGVTCAKEGKGLFWGLWITSSLN